jgi:uncharacterized protein (DUF1800 family)
MDNAAVTAFTRFGLGRRRGEAVPADPRAWLRQQIQQPDPTPVEGRPSCSDCLDIFYAFADAKHEAKRDMAAQKMAGAGGGAANPQGGLNDPEIDALRERLHQHIKAESNDLLGNALITPTPFRERLVWFWVNHFTVANRGGPIGACAGAYVREAIRPHVTGNFRDMLLAVMRHPAMLEYLDQSKSVGPNSRAGERAHHGLNENLARECLELHTVTPASGYSQADVTEFARVLTGWSVKLRGDHTGFLFRPEAHEPGTRHVMGYDWPDGEAGGVALLAWLANHPATHRHLAEKLVRHFVADDPPPRDVAVIEAVLRRTGGDLREASLALITLPGAWKPLTKLRTPQDYVIATLRAVGATVEQVPNMAGIITGLGQPFFKAPFPIGWSDRAADWSGSEALMQRVDFAYGVAGRAKDIDPDDMVAEQLGSLADADTAAAIRRAGSRQDALTLLLACPAFQRR